MISKKVLIISLVVVLLLGGLYFFISSEDSPAETEKKTETVQVNQNENIFEADKNDISNLFIKNSSGEYEFYLKEATWYVRGGEQLLYNQPLIFSTILDYVTVTPSLVVEKNPSDIATYGLDDPRATVTVKITDGREATFALGDETKGGNGYYFMMKGDSAVYTISKAFGTNMEKALTDYRDIGLFELTEDEIQEVSLSVYGTGEVTIRRMEEQQDMMTSWEIIKPYSIGVYDEKFSAAVLTPLIGVEVSKFLSDDPTEEQLQSSGLKEPSFWFEVSTEKDTYKVLLGNEYDGYYAAKREDLPSVYLVSQSAVSFLFVDVFEYMNKYEYLPRRDEVEEISFTSNGAEHRLDITDAADKEKIAVKLDGNSIPVDEYTTLFQQIFGIAIQGHKTSEPESAGDVTLSYTVKKADGTVDNVSYVRMNGMFSYQLVNGKCSFYVYNDDVDAAVEAMESLSELAKNPGSFEEEEVNPVEKSEGFSWLALIAVIAIVALIAVFPISILRESKKKKKE